VQAHHVHVSLDHQQAPQAARCLARLIEPIELPPLVEQLGFRGVQVLGLALVQHAAAEGDGPPARVADREHDPIAESVVVALRRAALRIGLTLDDEAGAHQYLAFIVGRSVALEQTVPQRWRVADAELLDHPGTDPALLQVLAGPRLAGQGLAEVEPSPLQREIQLVVRLLRRRRAALAGHLESRARGEVLDGLDEARVVVLHQEAECRAVRPASEAVVELLVGADPERRRLLVVEGQQALYSRPARFSCTRPPITSTMSVRAISSSMKCCGMRPATVRGELRREVPIVGAPRRSGKAPLRLAAESQAGLPARPCGLRSRAPP